MRPSVKYPAVQRKTRVNKDTSTLYKAWKDSLLLQSFASSDTHCFRKRRTPTSISPLSLERLKVETLRFQSEGAHRRHRGDAEDVKMDHATHPPPDDEEIQDWNGNCDEPMEVAPPETAAPLPAASEGL